MEEMNGVFRTSAFGGFNKEDVLGFIEMQKRVEADLRASTEALDAKLRALSAQLEKAVAEKAEAENELAENVQAREAASALAIKEAEYRSLENKYAALMQNSSAAVQENETLQKTVEQLRARITELEEKANKPICAPVAAPVVQKSMEEQVGSAIMDARRFADQIISDAKGNAAAVNEKTRNVIAAVDKKAGIIEAELQLCAEKCARWFAEAESDLEKVKKELADVIENIGFEL